MELPGSNRLVEYHLNRQLTDNQRYVLQQISNMNGEGYLCSLRKQIKEITGKDISLGRMGDLLDKMERRRWIAAEQKHIEMEWTQGERPAKGKRRVKTYALLPMGVRVLSTIKMP